jgi:hypothetical protein
MRRMIFALVVGGAALATVPPGAQAAPVLAAPLPATWATKPMVQQVWYDRWGRWHPPRGYYGYGYGPPRPYAYGPPRPYWRHRRAQCLRHGWC